MSGKKTRVLLIQLGSPKDPSPGAVRGYLRDFLGDPRVVDLPPFFWKIILYLWVLPFRPRISAKAYARIWDGKEFPLVRITKEFAGRVATHLPQMRVDYAFLLGKPRLGDVWESWDDVKEVIIIPLFPQYCEGTSASCVDAWFKELRFQANIPSFSFVTSFHRSRAFIDNSVIQINQFLKEHPVDVLILSFHGIPKRRVREKGDLYGHHCLETFELIKQGVDISKVEMSFQSRFGREEWLTPYTDKLCLELAKENKKMAVYCPSFVADCLETIDEIQEELGKEVKLAGGELFLIPCLNANALWCKDFAGWVSDRNEYPPKERQPVIKSTNPNTKPVLKIIFLTLFLDLAGFSIIFPLFPELVDHYLRVDGENIFLRGILKIMEQWASWGGVVSAPHVLFGGILGTLYSLLQFLAAPFWGGLSDRIGRRPVLLISLSGLALSYVLWAISGSFTLLILSRFIGGIMGGNISAATAVIGDVTSKNERARGMAIVGIAFSLGLIFGPALGGVLGMLDLTSLFPGANPFSAAAILALVLCLFNLAWVIKKFPETLPLNKRKQSGTNRSINPLVLFRPLSHPGINKTNGGYFLFLTAFAGMEFTLTFLAVERLSYSVWDNAVMFIVIGMIIALVQGGYVRRKASTIGEKRMALRGLITIVPGLICLGYAYDSLTLYVGLVLLSVGSAMSIPCLTALVSIYAPREEQGRAIGIFRSLGALARAVGPILAAIFYWRWGASSPYFLGAVFLLIPILIIGRLPPPEKD